jgi:TolA-binding protein
VGRQYNDFTAYYNTFYNANQSFEKGLKSFREKDRVVDRRRYLPVFRSPSAQATNSGFEEAIQKSADVLREHPSSKWVDDALLLIGKSYFYQENYVGAAQKFREVVALESDRETEARFWLARTLTSNGRLAQAAEALRLGDRDGPPENPWTARMYLVRGELLVRQEQWEAAEAALERGLSGDLPDEVAGRGAFLLGQVRETLGVPEEARRAYRQVQRHDPAYELGFAARLSEIELQGRHGNAETALGRLRDLEADDKNLDNRGEISLVQAQVSRALGRPDEARAHLRDALYGRRETSSGSGQTRGYLHYELATLYRDVYEDFDRAAAHLDTASTELSGPSSPSQDRPRLPSVPGELATTATQYQNLARQAREVSRMDSLLRLGRMPDDRFQSYVDSLRRRRAEQRARETEDRAGRRRQFRGQPRTRPEDRERPAPAAETRSSDAGFLFHRDPTRVQEGRRQFEDTWGDRPRVDNWRRRNAMRRAEAAEEEGAPPATTAAESPPDDQATSRREGLGPTSSQGGGAGGLDLSVVPRDSAARVKMEAERAVARYELANALFLVASRPDSAATWYRRILQENGDQPVARRALYALGEAYRAQGDTTAARQAFERLVEEYPSTPLAGRAQQQLGRQTQGRAPSRERSAVADSVYSRAYEQWEAGAWRPALTGLLDVAQTYPETEAAPRALLAAGILYWQRLQADSVRAPQGPIVRYLSARDSTARDSTTWPVSPLGRVASTDSVEGGTAAGDSLSGRTVGSVDSVQKSFSGFGSGTAVGASRVPSWPRATDSTAVPDSVLYRPLTGLLAHLADEYPEAPQVKRAQSMLSLIEERSASTDTTASDSTDRDSTQTPSPADSAVVAVADSASKAGRSARPGRAPRPDTSGQLPDTARTSTGREPLPAPGGETRSSREGAPANRAAWTLFVEAFPSPAEASSRAEALRRQLGDEWSVQTVRDPAAEEPAHLIVIGQFGSQRAARQVRSTLEDKLSRRLEIRRMPGGP